MRYFLAVDGGGTKTQFALCDTQTGTLELMTFGPSNHELLPGGLAQMRENLQEMAGQILDKHHLTPTDIHHSAWGLAGLDTKSQYHIIHGFIKEAGFKNFSLSNDADLGIKANFPEGCGICFVNGTGLNVVGINEKGERYQIGAHFALTGDYGGGLILGQEAIRLTYMNLFRHRRETILTKMVMDKYVVTSRHDFMERVVDWENREKLPIPGVAKCIFDAAALGDEEADEVLERMAHEGALCIKSLITEIPFVDHKINIVLIGSLFTQNWSDAPKRLQTELKQVIPEKEFALHIPKYPPVVGALAWAFVKSEVENPWHKAMRYFTD